MELRIGEVITVKRKEKGWTQEQLANAVGVSTPAVSKWETGATYPDITLLSPIARALHSTVDELLSFQNELSSAEVSGFVKKAAGIYESEGFDSGWNYCQNLFREYPNSVPLKFYLGNLFQSFMVMKSDIGQKENLAYYRQAAELYEEVLASGSPKFTYQATYILVGFYTVLNVLDRAEELLDSLPKKIVDPDFLYPSIFALRGKTDESRRLIQENIKRYISKINQELRFLCAFAREQEDMDTAYTLAKINLEMTRLFGIYEEFAYPDMIEVLTEQGEKESALNYLETYTQHILELDSTQVNHPVFDSLAEEPKDTTYIRKALAKSMLLEMEDSSLKEEPRYDQIVRKLRGIIHAQSHTFQE